MEQQRHSEHPLNSQMTILEEERGKDKGSHSSSSFLCPPPLSVSNLSGKSEEEEEEEERDIHERPHTHTSKAEQCMYCVVLCTRRIRLDCLPCHSWGDSPRMKR